MNRQFHSKIPLHLKELISMGYVFSSNGNGVNLDTGPKSILPYSHVLNDDEANIVNNKTGVPVVAFCFDGPFLPIRNGASYTLFSLLNALGKSGKIYPILVICYRGDDPSQYFDKPFKTIFVHPNHYYQHDHIISEVFNGNMVSNVQFCSSEGLLNLGPYTKKLGMRIIFDIQNIDHVLEERLGHTNAQIQRAKQLQEMAILQSDYVLCRSDIDAQYATMLGASKNAVNVYRGGIDLSSFLFLSSRPQNKKLVFLAHMYYEPNVNAFTYFVEGVLPQLPPDFTLTIIGNTPRDIIENYNDRRIEFKQGIDDINTELRHYAIAIAPILEGSGTRLKILDYLASGLPVVATSVAIEGLVDGIEGVVSVCDTTESMIQSIKSISKNPSRYVNRSMAGRDYVEQYYDFSLQLDPFINAYTSP